MAHIQKGNSLQESRRRQDDIYREMTSAMKHDQQMTHAANFEIKTTQKLNQRNKQAMIETKKKEYEVKLLERRKKLAKLYNEELEEWRQEELRKIETPEDRKQRIMEKAYALKEAREQSRQEYVQKRLADQWKDSCDDARTLDSKAMVMFLNQERIKQIHEKMKRKEDLSRQENSFLSEWNRQLEELAKRDQQKAEYRRKIDRETSQAIKSQVIFTFLLYSFLFFNFFFFFFLFNVVVYFSRLLIMKRNERNTFNNFKKMKI
jgi:hypothetical protein